MASLLQSPLVSALRHRAATDPAGVLQEVKQLLTVRGPTLKTFSPSDIHQLTELDHDLDLGPVGGAGPVTRSRKRKPVGISVLESPTVPEPSVQPSPSPATRRSEKSGGHAPMISPALPYPALPCSALPCQLACARKSKEAFKCEATECPQT